MIDKEFEEWIAHVEATLGNKVDGLYHASLEHRRALRAAFAAGCQSERQACIEICKTQRLYEEARAQISIPETYRLVTQMLCKIKSRG